MYIKRSNMSADALPSLEIEDFDLSRGRDEDAVDAIQLWLSSAGGSELGGRSGAFFPQAERNVRAAIRIRNALILASFASKFLAPFGDLLFHIFRRRAAIGSARRDGGVYCQNGEYVLNDLRFNRLHLFQR